MSPLLLPSCPQIVCQVQIHRDPKRELHPHACPAPPVRKPPRSRFVLPESLLRAGSPQWAHVSLPSMGKRVKEWDDEWKCLFIYLCTQLMCFLWTHTMHHTFVHGGIPDLQGESPWSPVLLGAVIRGPQNKHAARQGSSSLPWSSLWEGRFASLVVYSFTAVCTAANMGQQLVVI